MKRLTLAFLILALSGLAQIQDAITIQTGPPARVTAINFNFTGTRGNTRYCYWVVSNYPSGSTFGDAVCTNQGPTTLNGTNFISPNWSPLSNVTSYDLLVTANNQQPSSPCTCAVATGLSATTANDTGSRSSYTIPNQLGPASGRMSLDNQSYTQPRMVIQPGLQLTGPALFFPDGTQQTSAAAGGGGGAHPNNGTTGQYSYYSAPTVIDSSDILSRDGTNRRNVMTRAGLELDSAGPATAPTATLVLAAGNVDAGAHQYVVTFVTAQGETAGTAYSNVVTADGTHAQVNLTSIAVGPTGTTARKVYRTFADCLSGGGCNGLLTTIANNTATTFTDNVADSGLGATAPFIDTTTGGFYFNSTLIGRLSNFTRFGVTPDGLDAYFNNGLDQPMPVGVYSETSNPGLGLFQDFYNFSSAVKATSNANSSDDLIVAGIFKAELTGSSPFLNVQGIRVQAVDNGSSTLSQLTGIISAPYIGGSTVTHSWGFRESYVQFGGANTTHSAFAVFTPTRGGGTLTNFIGLDVPDLTLATNNWAIKTGVGKVQWGDIDQHFNSAGNPNAKACAAALYGSTYFNTTDKRLCICIADGTDDAWVKSSDYTHATGHCTP